MDFVLRTCWEHFNLCWEPTHRMASFSARILVENSCWNHSDVFEVCASLQVLFATASFRSWAGYMLRPFRCNWTVLECVTLSAGSEQNEISCIPMEIQFAFSLWESQFETRSIVHLQSLQSQSIRIKLHWFLGGISSTFIIFGYL